jgi:hypothetical protein
MQNKTEIGLAKQGSYVCICFLRSSHTQSLSNDNVSRLQIREELQGQINGVGDLAFFLTSPPLDCLV